MKFDIKYVSNSEGEIQYIQAPLTDWEKLLATFNKYQQTLKIKSDLKEAFA